MITFKEFVKDMINSDCRGDYFMDVSEKLVLINDGTYYSIVLKAEHQLAIATYGDETFENYGEAYQKYCDATTPILSTERTREENKMNKELLLYAAGVKTADLEKELDELCPDWKERFLGE